jgi:uncharacterized protein (DUF2062 family)
MPKKFIKRWMPDHERIRSNKYLKIFGTLLHDPNLWHFNRRSVSGAFAIGMFMAFIPVPFQMVLAAAAAIPLRMNLPLSVGLVWITNPLTMPVMFYATYKLGTLLLGTEPTQGLEFEISLKWFIDMMSRWREILIPLFLGSIVAGTFISIGAYFLIRLLWRWHVVKEWKLRKLRRSE